MSCHLNELRSRLEAAVEDAVEATESSNDFHNAKPIFERLGKDGDLADAKSELRDILDYECDENDADAVRELADMFDLADEIHWAWLHLHEAEKKELKEVAR